MIPSNESDALDYSESPVQLASEDRAKCLEGEDITEGSIAIKFCFATQIL
jgi:hypothetical protein